MGLDLYLEFIETNPDKGTETISKSYQMQIWIFWFIETNPDKGTETFSREMDKLWFYPFIETNPDKGTETSHNIKDVVYSMY